MNTTTLLFYLFSTVLVGSSLMVVTVRNSVHAALFLILAFFTCSALWLLLEAEFLAIVLVLVYVGAVMVLFLFVVMMLDVDIAPKREGFTKYLPLGALVATIVFLEMAVVVGPDNFGLDVIAQPIAHAADYSNTKELGSLLYTTYVYPFEIAAVILLVAMIAAIALTMRKRPDSKSQRVQDQVLVKASDRLRVVKMDAVKK